jgi:hypothetical protein
MAADGTQAGLKQTGRSREPEKNDGQAHEPEIAIGAVDPFGPAGFVQVGLSSSDSGRFTCQLVTSGQVIH